MTTLQKTARFIAVALGLALSLAACGGGTSSAPSNDANLSETGQSSQAGPNLTGEITVLAAASLTESFTVLADQFMAEHDGTTVKLSFGSSSALALTVAEGSPVDILATADLKSMDVAIADYEDVEPLVFAGNDLVIAVAKDNPKAIEGLEQLSKSDLLVSKCAAEVPCGRLTGAAVEAGDLILNAVTEGADVKATFAPLITGEVDAALVYRTDALASANVDLVEIETHMAQQTEYPLAILSDTGVAQAFYDYLLSDQGTQVLAKHGFSKP